jgi:hypothetical protein
MAELATSMEVRGPGGAVRLGEVELPGQVQAIDVDNEVLYDEARTPSRSGTSRQPQGFGDGTVTIRVRFLDQRDGLTALEQVKQVEGLFKAVDPAARPRIFRLVNVLTRARGIRDVMWKTFKVAAKVGVGWLEGDLVLVEHRPAIVAKERAAAWKAGLGDGSAALAGGLTAGITNLAGTAIGAGLQEAIAAGGGYVRDQKVAPYRRALERGRTARSSADRLLMKVPPRTTEESEDVKRQQAAAELRSHRRM